MLTNTQVAAGIGLSLRSWERARFIFSRCSDELKPHLDAAMESGAIALHRAEQIVRLPHDRQLAELQRVVNEPPRKQKRAPRTIRDDMNEIANVINAAASRWSDDDRRIARIILNDFARQLAEGRDCGEDEPQE